MVISIVSSIYPVYGATVFYANGAFTQNGIEWCEENEALYDILGDKFFEHHSHSIESRICANLIEDELWNYSGIDRMEKLIDRSRYFSELEIAESQVEADAGVVDPTPADVPDRIIEVPKLDALENITEEDIPEEIEQSNGGGCLIATAAFDSELSSQVQMLREVRDNKVLNTKVGAMFISGFNQIYYSFSPVISDMERQSPLFKEFVKITITPLIVSLSMLNNVNIDSEIEMLGAGISIISLNVGMYFIMPITVGIILKRNLFF